MNLSAPLSALHKAVDYLKKGIFWDFGCRKIGKNRNIKISRVNFLRIPTRIMHADFWVNQTIFQRLDPIFLRKNAIFLSQKTPYNL